MPRKYKRGDKVYMINQKLSGEFFSEGKATIIGPHGSNEDLYVVQFKGRDEFPVVRYVDPEAQASTFALKDRVDSLNAGQNNDQGRYKPPFSVKPSRVKSNPAHSLTRPLL